MTPATVRDNRVAILIQPPAPQHAPVVVRGLRVVRHPVLEGHTTGADPDRASAISLALPVQIAEPLSDSPLGAVVHGAGGEDPPRSTAKWPIHVLAALVPLVVRVAESKPSLATVASVGLAYRPPAVFPNWNIDRQA